MARRNRPHSSLLLIVLAFVVFAGACSQSNTPETWGEAQEDGNLRPNFIRACTEANAEGGDVEFTAAQASNYCGCAFEEIVEYFGGAIAPDSTISAVATAAEGRDFDAFKTLEADLRKNPEQIPTDIEAMLTGCTNRAKG